MDTMSRKCESQLGKYPPDVIIIACGTNDLVDIKENNIINMLRETIDDIHQLVPRCHIMFSDILPR